MRSITVQHTSFFILLALVTAAFLGLIRDFLQPLFWAAVFAILFHPLQDKIRKRFQNRPTLAAVLTIVVIIFLVIVPSFLIVMAVTKEAAGLYERLSKEGPSFGDVFQYVNKTLPAISEYLSGFGVDFQKIQERLSGAAISVSGFLASQMVNIGQVTATFVINFLLMFYILFFFLRDGRRIVRSFVRCLPLGDMRERMLLQKFAEVSRVTVKGTLIVGAVQGGIGGLLFWILGIKGAVLWAVLMMILSLLPAVGTAIVWGPASIILIAEGNVWKGIILVIGGTLIIGLVDNLLRPILVGRGARMPDFLVLIATLGGLTAFGISGFVLGPILAALFLSMWDMFAQEYMGSGNLAGTRVSTTHEEQKIIPP